MRRATWILWLLLALLPLRSWAAASMGLPQSAAVTVGAAQDDVIAHGAAMPPCHQAAADEGSAAPAGSTCQSCDWCHAALGLAPRVAVGSMPSPSDPPAVRAERDTGRAAIDGLERPPRPDLA